MPTSSASGPRDWDAATYDRVGAPMTRRGLLAVDRLELQPHMTVLDAGCGTGRVTAAVLERLGPEGRVIALDGSPSMVAEARAVLGDDPRVAFVVADLGADGFAEPGSLCAVVSTSTFHWVPDHPALWRRLHAALKPGGQLVVDCGGAGNIARILQALRDLGVHDTPWTFDDPETATRELQAAGFTDVHARLRADPAPVTRDGVETYLRTVVLGSYVAERSAADADALVAAVARALGPEPVIDYVRLELEARKP
ncbi:trans-aconitate 2-methyltransferase [Conexibacter sp. SYSU D00693]|uniref:class I SAM-dependent methyltransferase n=1 Tax=Conexibacter sp. SYSU D00693 TaxID=2812560 RepID=UPI00196B40F9|nr:class I SAM-dependent methyltransferase [Conexibacter sp. SYSU D00693]